MTIMEIKWEALPGDNKNEEIVATNEKHPDQPIVVGKHLSPQVKNQLVQLLANSLDIFAWTPDDMTRVPREFVEHILGLNQYAPPVVQKRMSISLGMSNSMTTQVRDLIQAGILALYLYL
ncbi:TO45-2 [Artemisia annua]|uniref:TO45-2 n=1 Tax=Artemisia annua TaxID=35608 RepID=A0A2U1KNF5_ARTAN|nr:TO45-2 [Artemisia annua]